MFSVPRGASESFLVTVQMFGLDLITDPWGIYFTVRLNDVVIITKRSALVGGSTSQIEVVGAQAFRVKIGTADTTRLPTCKALADCFITKAADRVQVIKPCAFEITKAVTLDFPTT